MGPSVSRSIGASMVSVQIDLNEFERHEHYYKNLGPSPENVLSPVDFYRYEVVRRELRGNSVIDVGCARADFLKLIQDTYQIAGIEITEPRAKVCNERLGTGAVIAADLEKKIELKGNSFDTVVCMEVLEHLIDPRRTLGELSRVSTQRVVFTVPFNEQVQYLLCVHCAKYTPYSGHLHSFNMENIQNITPPDMELAYIGLVCNSVLRRLPAAVFKLPYGIIRTMDRILNAVFPRAKWMLVVLDKADPSEAGS